MNKSYLIKNRASIVFKCFFITIIILWTYIFYLQVIMYNFYFLKSKNNYTRYKIVHSIRGAILDRNGLVIATTAPLIKLFWNKIPYGLNYNDEDLIKNLEEILKININKEILLQKNLENKILLSEDLSLENLCIILENFNLNKRIIIENYTKRIYKYDNLACHAIGYINSKDSYGVTGIEKICNNNLQGNAGEEKIIINSKGNIIDLEIIKEPEKGLNIYTTLDLKLQKIIERVIPDDVMGSVILLNPINGDILALLSSPRFNPEVFLSKINNELWDDFDSNKTLLNRCFQASYHPGSIFKIISAVTMLEEGIINEHTTWFCPGFINYKDRKYNCVNKNGHGLINIVDAIAYSCNIPFFLNSISKLNIDLINKYSNIYGLGSQTNSLFKEDAGFIPNKNWKKKVYGEKWYIGETLSVSIGQGSLKTTPIQLALIISSIMTGYKVKPKILKSEKIIKESINVKEENLNIIKNGMLMSSRVGSCHSLKYLKNWKIYGKTGTAQVCSMKLSKDNENDLKKQHHGLFACYAENITNTNNNFVLVIIIEHCKSSAVATKYAYKIFKEIEKENFNI